MKKHCATAIARRALPGRAAQRGLAKMRILKWIGAVFLALVLVTAMLLYWLLGTESGARFVLARAVGAMEGKFAFERSSGRPERARVSRRVPEVENGFRARCPAERLLQERNMSVLVLSHDLCELAQLTPKLSAGECLGIERRLKVFEQQRVVEDLRVLLRRRNRTRRTEHALDRDTAQEQPAPGSGRQRDQVTA
jgi:hypothetical protein